MKVRRDYKVACLGHGIDNLREFHKLLKTTSTIPSELDRQLVSAFVQLEYASKEGQYDRIVPLMVAHRNALVAIRNAIADNS